MRSPVFRHAGSWRNAGRVWWCPIKIAPRRWCGAVASAMVCIVLCVNVVRCGDGLPPPPGWHHGGAHRWSPHVADTPVGEIRGYARLQPLRGWGNVRLWSSASRGARCAMLASRADAALRRIGGSQPLLRCASSARGWGEWGEWAAIGGVHALRWQRMGAWWCRCRSGAWRLRAALPIGPIGPILPIGPIAAATG